MWHPDIPEEYRNQVVLGDARELAVRIPDDSVDLIITDPPYLKEYLHLYGWLAETAARVLKQGGYLFAYGAVEHEPATLDYIRPHLDYFWVDAILHINGLPRMWHKRLMSGYKPVFVFTNGPPLRKPWRGTVDADGKDKRYHSWGQGAGYTIRIVDMLTDPGDVVYDPFVGGGTTPSACELLKRNWIASDIDPEAVNTARERLANRNLTLPEFEYAQSEMFDHDVLHPIFLGGRVGDYNDDCNQ